MKYFGTNLNSADLILNTPIAVKMFEKMPFDIYWGFVENEGV